MDAYSRRLERIQPKLRRKAPEYVIYSWEALIINRLQPPVKVILDPTYAVLDPNIFWHSLTQLVPRGKASSSVLSQLVF